MSVRNPWNSYRQVAMQTATPGQLVLMLFDGAIRCLDRAEVGFGHEDPAEKNQTIHNNVVRAQQILDELKGALDLTAGGALARTLQELYEYMDGRLTDSNRRKAVEPLQESRKHLHALRDAWAQMLGGQPSPDAQCDLAAA